MKRAIYKVGPPADDPVLSERLGQRGHRLWVGGPVPRGAEGITLGSLVLVRKQAAIRPDTFDVLLRHEQVHVAQYRELGVVRFLMHYVGSYIRLRAQGHSHYGAYRRIPLEVEARWWASQPFGSTSFMESEVSLDA